LKAQFEKQFSDGNLHVLESLLITRLAVDKSVVMPRIEEFVLYHEKYPDLVSGGWEIVGR
jgi:hypothetical protein